MTLICIGYFSCSSGPMRHRKTADQSAMTPSTPNTWAGLTIYTLTLTLEASRLACTLEQSDQAQALLSELNSVSTRAWALCPKRARISESVASTVLASDNTTESSGGTAKQPGHYTSAQS